MFVILRGWTGLEFKWKDRLSGPVSHRAVGKKYKLIGPYSRSLVNCN